MRRGKLHRGLDIQAPLGTLVRAALAGEVTRSAENAQGYGRVIYLKHSGGIETWYVYHYQNLVKVGQRVAAGDVIAHVGNSGRSTRPHLHFEIRIRDQAVDPLIFLPAHP
jgi:murein DD-endopeptidase MepM/ murein hydrolase activator NlpD